MQVNSGLIQLKLDRAEGIRGLNLRQGQVLLARVSQLLDGEHARISMGGRQLVAKTEVRLHENTTIKLQVEGMERDRLILRLVSDRPQIMLTEKPERLFSGTPLREGQVVNASVVERQGDGQVKLQVGNQTLQARANVNLAHNQSLRMEVANLGPNKVLLNLVDNASNNTSSVQQVAQHLEALGIRDNGVLKEKLLSRVSAIEGTRVGSEATVRAILQEVAPRLAASDGAVRSMESFVQHRDQMPNLLGQLLAGLEKGGRGSATRDDIARILTSYTITSNDSAAIRDQMQQAFRFMYLTPEQIAQQQLKLEQSNISSLALALSIIKAKSSYKSLGEPQMQQLGSALTGAQLLSSETMGSAAQFFLPFLLENDTQVLVGFKRRKREDGEQANNVTVKVDSQVIGGVDFKLNLLDNQLRTDIIVERKDTKKLIEDNVQVLANRMEKVGLHLVIASIEVASEKRVLDEKRVRDNKSVRINILV
ncbi:hypothetical protein GGQ84_000764 [Desulfitispora alkaliphila]|uniref:flagellar hook-length control protein FliK n=1 Tax=Desulfitispora alkaliphila TaxID=622674 RepID=UPI003D1D7CA1